jgi:hypothetical protein
MTFRNHQPYACSDLSIHTKIKTSSKHETLNRSFETETISEHVFQIWTQIDKMMNTEIQFLNFPVSVNLDSLSRISLQKTTKLRKMTGCAKS